MMPAVRPLAKTQAQAKERSGKCFAFDTVLIGNPPTACFLAPTRVLLPHAACA